jgi:hypothetical protein
MRLTGNIDKIGLYILSLSLLFIFIIILSANVPYCFGNSCKFIGLTKLLSTNLVPVVCIFFIFIGWVFYRRFRNITSYNGLESVKITHCESENYENLTFLATYIVPFMGFSFDDMQKNLAYLLLIVVIWIIFVKTNKYYANPTLALFGYKLYKVNIFHPGSGETKDVIAITTDNLRVGDNVFYSFLDDYVFIARKKI